MSEVKPGQVWKKKGTGMNWTVTPGRVGESGHCLRSERGVMRVVSEHILFDDYVLVKEAP